MLVAFLLTLAGLAAIFAPVLLYLPDLPAFVPFAALGAGAAWAWFAWGKRRGAPRLAGAVLLTLLPSALAYWFLVLSAYPAAEGAPAVGTAAPAITAARVGDGAEVRLPAGGGDPFLLVFYRGSW
ncbi:MAG: hypothetical protein ACE5JG_00855 [Planctomycetota bacterium]